jgi:hypothetical protein
MEFWKKISGKNKRYRGFCWIGFEIQELFAIWEMSRGSGVTLSGFSRN